MAEFRFVTLWNIEAPRSAVCEAIEHSLEWPQWWPGLERVEEVAQGDANGIGSVRRYLWKSRLPYRLGFDIRVTSMQPLTMVEGIACGDVEGVGRWSFTTEGALTVARYDWQVRPTACWMRLVTPLASPLFRWNHDILMKQGAEGLARRLNARLVGFSSKTPALRKSSAAIGMNAKPAVGQHHHHAEDEMHRQRDAASRLGKPRENGSKTIQVDEI